MFKEFDEWLYKEGPGIRVAAYFSLIFMAIGLTILLIIATIPTLTGLLIVTTLFSVSFGIATLIMFFTRPRRRR